jgi:hypothetical protein
VVDAAIAEVSDTSTVNPHIDYIGAYQPVTFDTVNNVYDGTYIPTLVNTPWPPVQKTGRTTSHTMGEIDSIDNALWVQYMSGYAYFEGQIGIKDPCGGKFSDGGDSGSLIVTIPGSGNLPQAVGLLFAGDSTSGITFANPIETVLTALTGSSFDTSRNGSGQPTGTMSMVTGTTASTTPYTTDSYTTYVNSCSGGGSGGGGGGKGGGKGGGNPHDVRKATGLDKAASVKKSHAQEIMGLANVVGHGIGVDEEGNAVINIYVSKDSAGGHYPAQIEGVNVRVINTGPIKAY